MIHRFRRLTQTGCLIVATLAGSFATAEERTQNFDVDPGWDGRNNRSTVPDVRTMVQEFGYSDTNHAGGKSAGELGGMITPAGEAAYYAKPIAKKSYERMMASGTLNCTGRHFNVLVCFFNANTLKEWRTPNTVALRLYGRGDVFYAYVEYATGKNGGSLGGHQGRKEQEDKKGKGHTHRTS